MSRIQQVVRAMLVTIAVGSASADTYTVGPATPGSIQALIDFVAVDGDIVLLEPGVFLLDAPINTRGKEIALQGSTDPLTGELLSALDGQGKGRVIECTSLETPETRLDRLIIQNGFGGGVWCEGSPTIVDCHFLGNANTNSGGGLVLYGHSQITGCLFMENSAPQGGGLWIAGGSKARLVGNEVRHNYIIDGNPSRVGGAYISSGAVEVANSKFCENDGPEITTGGWIDAGGNQISALCGCLGDINLDNSVDGTDLGVVFALWSSSNPVADFDVDGTVGPSDLGILLAQWGPCP